MKNRNLDKFIKEAKKGDSRAFAELYGFFASDLYRFALYFTGNCADAEDCVQEAVLLSFKNLGSLKNPSSFKSWLFKILSNVCKTKLNNPADRLYPIPIHEILGTEKEIYHTDFSISAELDEALNQLSPDEKQVVLLSVIGRYKSSEIAHITGMTPGSVRSKLSRSLAKLREILQ